MRKCFLKNCLAKWKSEPVNIYMISTIRPHIYMLIFESTDMPFIFVIQWNLLNMLPLVVYPMTMTNAKNTMVGQLNI